MSNNQLYPYDALNNNDNLNAIKKHTKYSQNGNFVVRQTIMYSNTIKSYNNKSNKNKNNNKNKNKNNNKNKNKNNNKNNYKVIIKKPKNNSYNYLISNTVPNTEIISINKKIYNDNNQDIKKLFGRIEFHMQNDNIDSFHSYWTDVLDKFNNIYNTYNGNNCNVEQYVIESALKKLHDNLTLSIKN